VWLFFLRADGIQEGVVRDYPDVPMRAGRNVDIRMIYLATPEGLRQL
jgi:hypothetical protein